MFDIQEELKKLPDKPGVYIMKDENGTVIYVGKAVVLKNRVRQYFQSQSNQLPKVSAMVARISRFEYIVTDSELEALILECNLIKKFRPKFNILLKDDKNYPYIKVTMNEDYPRIFMTRRVDKDGARYFGPYSNVTAVRETIGLLKKLFPVKTCQKVLPRDIGRERPCLNYYIYQCLGPCQGDVNKEEYRSLMKDICSFLGGRQQEVVKRLEEAMLQASEDMEFEKAARLRDKLGSLRQVAEKQKVLSTAMEDQDVVGIAREQTDACAQVFFIREGKLIGREHFILEGASGVEGSELMTSFIKQFYSAAANIPGELVLQEGVEEPELIEKWLGEKKGGRVRIRVPQRGDKVRLVEMVAQNAAISLQQFKERLKSEESFAREGLSGITGLAGLEKEPMRIEAYDISNTGETEKVASMVVFERGRPAKHEYRRFKIKSVEGQNDYASMQEIIFRRFRNSSDKFARMPDLLLLDGGLGHLNAVGEVLSELNIGIPALGMVKDDRHRTRGLVSVNGTIDLENNLPVLRFVTAIQDEAHRFALDYNKRLREKRYQGSVLDEIPGIGSTRRKALIKHFGSVSKIKTAEPEELAQVEGISANAAKKIYEYFH